MYFPLFNSIACIIQAQIFDDLHNPDLKPLERPEFYLNTMLPVEYGGYYQEVSVEVVTRETENDPELLEKILTGEVPTIQCIYR
jgi:hypothetical protein